MAYAGCRLAIVFTAAALALGVSVSTPAGAAIRALFVGIDQYEYSAPTVADADFRNLRGAVADSGRIKDALRDAYGLDLDRATTGCASSNAVSTTLTDSCATRAAIFAALDERIAQSAKGDTLIFYYAGHGSRISDTKDYDQASGSSSTILPYDARGPADTRIVEILDRELRRVIDGATAKGLNVVTIFDSCFSRTATRTFRIGGRERADEGESRFARTREYPGVARIPMAPDIGPGSGYRVHLAAANESEEAREVPIEGGVGVRAGVFTSALAATLRAIPQATFDDIAAEVRRKVRESGFSRQTPQAEGSLLATLGGGPRQATLLSAKPVAAGAELQAGMLSSVTEGSTFALFADSTSALREAAVPLATGTVAAVNPFSATILIDSPPAQPLPARLIAREVRHAFGATQMRVRIDTDTPGAEATIAGALATSRAAKRAEPAQYVVATTDKADGYAALFSLDKSTLARLGPLSDPKFGDILRDALEKLAHVNALLALRTDPAKAALSFCIDNDLDYDVYTCPAPKGPKNTPEIIVGKRAKVTVTQSGTKPRYIYVFGIDEALQIDLVVPEPGTIEPAITPRRPAWYPVEPNTRGRYRFVTIATDQPIQGAALQQDRAGARDPAGCRSTLDRLLCAAASGTHDPSAPRVGGWTAIVTDAFVLGDAAP